MKTTEQLAKERKEKELQKIQVYRKLVDDVQQKRKDGIFDNTGLEYSEKVLEMNPEFYSLWNYRRQIYAHLTNSNDANEMRKLYEFEMKFLESAIRQNPKCYWTWHHRKWVGEKIADSWNWEHELKLCNLLLAADTRNFHCWSYRRYVASMARISPHRELEFTTVKVEEDFSNYSAWHQRSRLLPIVYKGKELSDAIRNELEMIWRAMYTYPQDQSPWIYYRWLIATAKQLDSEQGQDPKVLLQQELSQIKELLEHESNSKWPLLTAVFLMREVGGHESEIQKNINLLCEVDPFHVNYYKDLSSKLQ